MKLRPAAGLTIATCLFAGCSNYTPAPPTVLPPAIPVPSSVVGTQGSTYAISVFAKAPGALLPDDLLQLGTSVFILYQDTNVNPDGTFANGATSSKAEVI